MAAAMTTTDLDALFSAHVTGLAPYNDTAIIKGTHLDGAREKRILAVVEVIHAAMASLSNDVEAKLLRTMIEKMLADISDSQGTYEDATPLTGQSVTEIADAARLKALEYMNRPSTPTIPQPQP